MCVSVEDTANALIFQLLRHPSFSIPPPPRTVHSSPPGVQRPAPLPQGQTIWVVQFMLQLKPTLAQLLSCPLFFSSYSLSLGAHSQYILCVQIPISGSAPGNLA